ncbi:putative F-box protein [Raphanus sativus]|nr:putative F-box protein [Raphanus sativus]
MSCFSSQSIHRYPMKIPLGHCYFSSMDSVHGLICIEDVKSRMPLVWNPTTGQLLPLPKPNMSSIHMNVFLGYDPVEGKHKVKNHGGPSELTFSIRVAMLLDDASME